MGTSSNKFKLDVCAKVSNPLGWDGDYIATVAYTAIDMVSNPLGWDGDLVRAVPVVRLFHSF